MRSSTAGISRRLSKAVTQQRCFAMEEPVTFLLFLLSTVTECALLSLPVLTQNPFTSFIFPRSVPASMKTFQWLEMHRL